MKTLVKSIFVLGAVGWYFGKGCSEKVPHSQRLPAFEPLTAEFLELDNSSDSVLLVETIKRFSTKFNSALSLFQKPAAASGTTGAGGSNEPGAANIVENRAISFSLDSPKTNDPLYFGFYLSPSQANQSKSFLDEFVDIYSCEQVSTILNNSFFYGALQAGTLLLSLQDKSAKNQLTYSAQGLNSNDASVSGLNFETNVRSKGEVSLVNYFMQLDFKKLAGTNFALVDESYSSGTLKTRGQVNILPNSQSGIKLKFFTDYAFGAGVSFYSGQSLNTLEIPERPDGAWTQDLRLSGVRTRDGQAGVTNVSFQQTFKKVNESDLSWRVHFVDSISGALVVFDHTYLVTGFNKQAEECYVESVNYE